jgi:hypothetical protein
MPTPAFRLATLSLVALAAAPAAQAVDFAPKGGRATLSVDYSYASSGKKRADTLDLREWKVLRTLHIDAQLTALAPAPLPSLQPMEAGQQARIQQQTAQLSKLADQSAPQLAGAQAVMDKCGDDDACLERESMRLAQAMAGKPETQATLKMGRETAAALAPGPNRYQAWQGQSQSGSYKIDETLHITYDDPGCVRQRGQRCTRHEVRQGGGPLKSANGSAALLEFDTAKSTLTLLLPAAHEALAYSETVTADDPEAVRSLPKGPQPRQLIFRPAPGKAQAPAFSVPLSGGWRSQSGVQTYQFTEANEGGGTLTVRWRFQVQGR